MKNKYLHHNAIMNILIVSNEATLIAKINYLKFAHVYCALCFKRYGLFVSFKSLACASPPYSPTNAL